jgi:uncharacterized membrane protein YbhN (UPF0104 family)
MIAGRKNLLLKVWGVLKYPILFSVLFWLCQQAEPIFTKIIIAKPIYGYLFMAAAVYQVGIFLIAERFRIMLRAIGISRTYGQCLSSYLESIPYFFISPGGVGVEFARYMKLKKDDPTETDQKEKIIFALLADRLIGFAAGVSVGLVGFPTLYEMVMQSDRWPFIGVVIIFAAGLVGAAIFWAASTYASVFLGRLKSILFLARSRPGLISYAALLGVFSQVSLGLTTYLVAQAVHIDISLWIVLWVTAAGMVLLVIPTTILGFTLMDVSVIMFYVVCGISLQDATFLSLVGYFMRIWLGLQGGVLEFSAYLRTLKRKPA